MWIKNDWLCIKYSADESLQLHDFIKAELLSNKAEDSMRYYSFYFGVSCFIFYFFNPKWLNNLLWLEMNFCT